jgi:hypothetical protein
MRKFIIFRHMADQLGKAFSRTAAAISFLLQNPPRLGISKIPLQIIRPVQIQQRSFIVLSENNDPDPLLPEKPVQTSQFSTDILSRFYFDRKHVSGLQARQCGRALVNQYLVRHFAAFSFNLSLYEFM